MSEADRMNELLRAVGSSHRVTSGDTVNSGILAMLEALPAYLDAAVEQAVKRRNLRGIYIPLTYEQWKESQRR